MAFKNWTRLFRRSEQQLEAPEVTDADTAAAQSPENADDHGQVAARAAMMKELEQGFHQVGRVVERFDDHLGTTNRLMESVAAEQERLPALITELTSAASASRQANEAVAQQLLQRDEANQKLLAHLASLSDSFELERDQHRAQLALVLRLQKGSRRVLIVMLLASGLFIFILLALVLVLALRPDLISQSTLPNPFTTDAASAAPLVPASDPLQVKIEEATSSPNEAIREKAEHLQQGQP